MAGVRHPGVLAWLHLVRTYHKMQRRASDHLGTYNLTLAQFDVLAQLSVNQGISQQALARHLLVTKGDVCGLINRLSERGLVDRREDPQDRRAHKLYLTEAGQNLAVQVVPEHEAFVLEQMGTLNADEQRFLQMLLRRLDRALGTE